MIKSYIAVDIETTGLDAKLDKIIEIGAIKVINGQTIDTYETFIDAGKQIGPMITKLTGITNEMIAGAPSPAEVIRKFLEFCDDLPLLGHNIMFDYSFLKRLAENERLTFQKDGIDTLKIARKHLKHLPKRSLTHLCSYYGIDQVHSHRAYDDAMAAKILYEKMAETYAAADDPVFDPVPLLYKVKKQGPVTAAQKRYLNDLLQHHKIKIDMRVEDLTKSEASRHIDRIISQYGKIIR